MFSASDHALLMGLTAIRVLGYIPRLGIDHSLDK
jgi:hypothetical protein